MRSLCPPVRFEHGCRPPRFACICLVTTLLLPVAAHGQVRDADKTMSAGENSGPLSDVSRPIGEGSRPVHGSLTIGESSVPVHSGPVRDAGTRSMLSGPVSEASRGTMPRTGSLSGGAVAEASAGAVKHDIDRPLGDRISEPLRELGPLQDQLRALRARAAMDAAAEAEQPVVEPAAEQPSEEVAEDFDDPSLPSADGAAEPLPAAEPDVGPGQP